VKYKLDKIIIDKRSLSHEIADRVRSTAKNVPVQIAEPDESGQIVKDLPLSKGKRILLLTVQNGGSVKPCPGTADPYICCKYTVINSANHCPMDCTYCVLQGYLERPCLTVFTNRHDIFADIDRVLKSEPHRFFRIGTGEFADSLALDDLTGFSSDIARFFEKKKNAVIELKTKASFVDNLLSSPPDNVVAAWSVNPDEIVRKEELRSASLKERLGSAKKCQDHGCMLAFHFDPLILYPGWKHGYSDVVRQIFSSVKEDRIAWISLGALRFPPPLKNIIKDRFPGTKIIYEEMIRGIDNKMRYILPLRVELFRHVFNEIRKFSKDLFVYFCMEPPWVWDSVMGKHPASDEELDFWFARSMYKRFPELNMEKPDRKNYKEDDFSRDQLS